jgi:hypothetical protein
MRPRGRRCSWVRRTPPPGEEHCCIPIKQAGWSYRKTCLQWTMSESSARSRADSCFVLGLRESPARRAGRPQLVLGRSDGSVGEDCRFTLGTWERHESEPRRPRPCQGGRNRGRRGHRWPAPRGVASGVGDGATACTRRQPPSCRCSTRRSANSAAQDACRTAQSFRLTEGRSGETLESAIDRSAERGPSGKRIRRTRLPRRWGVARLSGSGATR